MAWHKGKWWPLYVSQWYSPGVSQHMFDPYSFTHLLHGVVGFYIWLGIFYYGAGMEWIWSCFVGFGISFAIELTWELVENSECIIKRYRETSGTSANYEGDSYQNIIGDLIACQTGYGLSWIFSYASECQWLCLPWLSGILSLSVYLITEVSLLLYMRDCLTLTFCTLICKIEKVSKWQEEGVENARKKEENSIS